LYPTHKTHKVPNQSPANHPKNLNFTDRKGKHYSLTQQREPPYVC
jgi:hypothetical protein